MLVLLMRRQEPLQERAEARRDEARASSYRIGGGSGVESRACAGIGLLLPSRLEEELAEAQVTIRGDKEEETVLAEKGEERKLALIRAKALLQPSDDLTMIRSPLLDGGVEADEGVEALLSRHRHWTLAAAEDVLLGSLCGVERAREEEDVVVLRTVWLGEVEQRRA